MKLLSSIHRLFGAEKRAEFTDSNGVRVKAIHCGFEGEWSAHNIEIHLSYSIRDGVNVNIKRLAPWRVLLEYSDGSAVINNEKPKYAQMLAELNALRENAPHLSEREAFQRLEEIVLAHSAVFLNAQPN